MAETELSDRLSPMFETPYYAVIFTTTQPKGELDGYEQTADDMVRLAMTQDGYLGVETVHDDQGIGITVSYWRDEASILAWKMQADHATAREAGRQKWYKAYRLRIAKVERAYEWNK